MKFDVLRKNYLDKFPWFCEESVAWYDEKFGDSNPSVVEFRKALEQRSYSSPEQKAAWLKNFDRLLDSIDAVTLNGEGKQSNLARVIHTSVIFEGTLQECQDYVAGRRWAKWVNIVDGEIQEGNPDNYTSIETAWGTNYKSASDLDGITVTIQTKWFDPETLTDAWVDV